MTSLVSSISDPSTIDLGSMYELDGLVSLLDDYRLARYMFILCLALIIYDYCLTFHDEIKYMFGRRFVWTKLLFLLNRYWPLTFILMDNAVLALVTGSNKFCVVWFYFFAFATFPAHFSIGAILVARLHVMYGCRPKILFWLCAVFALELTSATAIIGVVAYNLRVVTLPPSYTGCVPTNIAHYAWMYWLPIATFETTLFTLAFAKSVAIARSESHTVPYVMAVLLRDSVAYFGCAAVVIFVNLVAWYLASQRMFCPFLSSAFTMRSILGCRLLLNIHKAHLDARDSASPISTVIGRFSSANWLHRMREQDLAQP
ncbi:hypothetical protein B0H21DRAFT_754870 [Amylocystis lapponica]|nr:hypothetical protein B0H21DRAFT_754870 [Amylocystis lapponica]